MAAKKSQPKKAFQPYPGLNYYTAESASSAFFAGRDEEVNQCASAIFQSNVLVLHGPTGCGKSSFLRAGVKPRIVDLGHGFGFTGKPDDFEVIRSTDNPLFEVGREIRRILARAETSGDAAIRDQVALAALKKTLNDPTRGGAIGSRARATARALGQLGDVLHTSPILVIDQAEEVFTLNDERRIAAAFAADDDALKAELRERRMRTREYFDFLYDLADRGGAVRIIVSLRTEYKGKFDDAVRRDDSGQERALPRTISGYYLGQLNEESLIEAIERPSCGDQEWARLFAEKRVRHPQPPRAPDAVRLIFEPDEHDENGSVVKDGTARRLAKELLKSDAVPPGGVLPALQVACVRLYRQACAALDGEGGDFLVRRMHLERLGPIQSQVDEYLSETIERACEEVIARRKQNKKRGRLDVTDLVDTMHRALADLLVLVESDGRAVTRQISDTEMRQELQMRWFERKLEAGEIDRIVSALQDAGLLRLEGGDEKRRTLGHDALALSLQKWRLTFTRDDGMMMRMNMNMQNQPKDWGHTKLYPEDDAPAPVTIYVARDFFWDRQLPIFASEMGFAQRLGIDFVHAEDPGLSPVSIDADGTNRSASDERPKYWENLVENVRRKDEQLEIDARRSGFANGKRVMIAADWGSFPLIKRNPTNDRPENADEVSQYADRWTDVLATNMSVGVALIGPEIDGLGDLGRAERAQRATGYVQEIQKSLLALAAETREVRIVVPNLAARRFLRFAADLVFPKGSHEHKRVKALLARKGVFHDIGMDGDQERYSDVDPLLRHLFDDVAHHESKRVTCVVAGAFTRAMAMQSGFRVYFGAKHLVTLARNLMEERAAAAHDEGVPAPTYGDAIVDISARIQQTLSHTLWQLSIPPGAAAFGRERAMVLRLASIGYFTSEFVRSNADDFVSFIQRFMNATMAHVEPGPNGVRGVRLSRGAVRQAVRECFHFARFDEFGEEVYDLDSVYGYWSDHAVFLSRSMASAIYLDLVRLRQRTLDHFESLAGSIAWLRYNNAYDPHAKSVRSTFALKEMAWRHFRIFNFYDSERLMSRAAQELLQLIERVQTANLGPAKGAKDGEGK